jgi:hypothetical protein
MLLLHMGNSILSQIANHGSFSSPHMYCAYPEEHLISRMTDPNPLRYACAHMRTRVLNHYMHHYLDLSEDVSWCGLTTVMSVAGFAADHPLHSCFPPATCRWAGGNELNRRRSFIDKTEVKRQEEEAEETEEVCSIYSEESASRCQRRLHVRIRSEFPSRKAGLAALEPPFYVNPGGEGRRQTVRLPPLREDESGQNVTTFFRHASSSWPPPLPAS